MLKKYRALIVTLAVSQGLLSGCASLKPNTALDAALATYERVSEVTLIDQYSTEDLNVAKAKLDLAQQAWKEKENKSTVNQRAYIAQQYALIAEQRSQLLRYQQDIENAKMDRASAQVELRAAEANRAKHEAETMQAKAESLHQQAKILTQDVNEREWKIAQQLAEIAELKALQAKDTDRGMVLTLGDVLFDTGESSLAQDAVSNIDRVATFLQKYPHRTLLIEGHTDNTGEENFNYNLSIERAQSVRQALTEKGIASSRIVARGFGEGTPVASNQHAAGRQQNRRVDLIFNESNPQIQDTQISAIDD